MGGTSPKPFVFVLMPFKEEFTDVYELGIKPACKAAGAYCERVDEQIFEGSIVERIYNQIAKADIVVSDMTGKNPNVFYETGYAHALGKRTILLTQKVEDIPFDLKHSPHVDYGKGTSALKRELKKRVKYFIDNPEKKQVVSPGALEYYVNGKNVETCQKIDVALIDHDKHLGWTISVGIHNPGNKTINAREMRFGFVFPVKLGKPLNAYDRYSMIQDENYMFGVSEPFQEILPKCWINKTLNIVNALANQSRVLSNESSMSNFVKANGDFVFHCSIRAFTELGMREHQFTIWII